MAAIKVKLLKKTDVQNFPKMLAYSQDDQSLKKWMNGSGGWYFYLTFHDYAGVGRYGKIVTQEYLVLNW